VIRFDGLGEFGLDLTELGSSRRATCMTTKTPRASDTRKRDNRSASASKPRTGRVLTIGFQGADRALRADPGGIHVGSTLAELRTAFTGQQVVEYLDLDFGQGTNGVVVTGSGRSRPR
jgi:hypothetical protein